MLRNDLNIRLFNFFIFYLVKHMDFQFNTFNSLFEELEQERFQRHQIRDKQQNALLENRIFLNQTTEMLYTSHDTIARTTELLSRLEKLQSLLSQTGKSEV